MNELDCLESLKQVVSMNNAFLFRHLLKKRENYHFFKSEVKKPQNTYFDAEINTLSWPNNHTCYTHVSPEGYDYCEFIIDVSIDGILSEFNNAGRTFFSIPIHFDFTIHASVYRDFIVNPEDIRILNDEQKSLLNFHKFYEKEKISSNIKPLNEQLFIGEDSFTFFTRIWKLVDHKNETMVADTSHDFLGELIEANRNICYSVACANMWGRYTTHYADHAYSFQGNQIYPVHLSYYDYRYFFYVENAVEEIYTFYERLSYLLYLFVRPLDLEEHNLSFQKIFDRKIRRQLVARYPQLALNDNFEWFKKRVSKEHKKLTRYRHPLIHYQTSSPFLKGSYNASLQRLWMKNVTENDNELVKLYEDIKDIQKFINTELSSSRDAFEKMVLLIEQLTVD